MLFNLSNIAMRTPEIKSFYFVLILSLFFACQSKQQTEALVEVPKYLQDYSELYKNDPRQANLEWFKDARFGLFMHYGVYSILEDGEWIQLRHDPPIPVADYDTLKNVFTAEKTYYTMHHGIHGQGSPQGGLSSTSENVWA